MTPTFEVFQKERSKSFPGICDAIGRQWGDETNLPTPVEQLNLF